VVLTAIVGLFVHLVPNISDYRLPQMRFKPQLMDLLWFLTAIDGFFSVLTAIDGFFAREVEKCPRQG